MEAQQQQSGPFAEPLRCYLPGMQYGGLQSLLNPRGGDACQAPLLIQVSVLYSNAMPVFAMYDRGACAKLSPSRLWI